MHRRLADEGVSFQLVFEKARRRLAEGLLVQSDHAFAEIAFLTGFSEQSSFTRAFKRWADESPAAFRERHAKA
ncbi:helix-turn-helix domain-containing protein [Jannaschia faecimaris]